MKKEIEIVSKWFSGDRAMDDMTQYTKNGLKAWEEHVVSTYFLPHARVLDVACGMGREAFALYDLGFGVSAVDISQVVMQKAEQEAATTNRQIDFALTNGLDLPFPNEHFDIVIMWAQAFGNIYGEDNQLHFLNECHRVLKKGGIISFSGHYYDYVKETYPQYTDGKKAFLYADTDCYWELFTPEELTLLAQKAGFDPLVCENTLLYNPDMNGQVLHCVAKKGDHHGAN